jgi:hypothetical protein
MTHGHSNRAPVENAVQRALARAAGTWGGYQAWRQLDPEKKIELVEQALGCPANDLVDSFPLAL